MRFQSTPSVWRETESSKRSVWMSNDFNPLPPCGGRLHNNDYTDQNGVFQSTPSVWRETFTDAMKKAIEIDFNPLPPCGGRQIARLVSLCHRHFNPLPPCGGRRYAGDIDRKKRSYFNPLPPCGGRPSTFVPYASRLAFQSTPSVWRETNEKYKVQDDEIISIHSLRVEGDISEIAKCAGVAHFNPLPPCGGRRWKFPVSIFAT